MVEISTTVVLENTLILINHRYIKIKEQIFLGYLLQIVVCEVRTIFESAGMSNSNISLKTDQDCGVD